MAGFTCTWKVVMWWIVVIPFATSPSYHGENLLNKKVTFIPRNEGEFKEQTKDLNCSHSEGGKLHPTFVISPFHNETRIGCFYEIHVTVKKCLEYNHREDNFIIQPSNSAPCHDLDLTPCKGNYSSTKSYELFQCFEKFGDIPSPEKKQMNIEHLIERERNLTKIIQDKGYFTNKTDGADSQNEDAGHIFLTLILILILIACIIFIFPFCFQLGRKKVKCGDFWKFCHRILKSLFSSWTTELSCSNQHDKGTPLMK